MLSKLFSFDKRSFSIWSPNQSLDRLKYCHDSTIPANKAPSGNIPTTLPGGGQNVTSWKRGRNFPENKAPAGNVPTMLAFGGKIWSKYDVIATYREHNWNSALVVHL